jgi:hypothetical protein
VGQAVLPARNGWRAGETEKGGRHRKLFSLRDGVPDGCAIRRTVQQQNTKGQVGNEIDNPYGVSPEHKFGVAGGMGPATEPHHLWGGPKAAASS